VNNQEKIYRDETKRILSSEKCIRKSFEFNFIVSCVYSRIRLYSSGRDESSSYKIVFICSSLYHKKIFSMKWQERSCDPFSITGIISLRSLKKSIRGIYDTISNDVRSKKHDYVVQRNRKMKTRLMCCGMYFESLKHIGENF